jgi:hypothetical protein
MPVGSYGRNCSGGEFFAQWYSSRLRLFRQCRPCHRILESRRRRTGCSELWPTASASIRSRNWIGRNSILNGPRNGRNAADEKAKAQRQNRELFDGLNDFLIRHGGKITSLRYTQPIRLELVQGSSLAASLAAMGFDPIFVEQVSRFGAIAAEPVLRKRRVTTPTDGFRAVDIFELRLPK